MKQPLPFAVTIQDWLLMVFLFQLGAGAVRQIDVCFPIDSPRGRRVDLVPNRRVWMCWVWVLALLVPDLVQGQSRWPDERTAGPFLCHADFPLNSHVNLLDELARLQRDLVRTLAIAD